MQLVETLLVVVAILVFLSGVSIVCGSVKKERASAMRMFFAALGAALWTLAIAAFLALPEGAEDIARIVVVCIIGGVVLCEAALLAYVSWKYKYGKLVAVVFGLIGAVLVGILAVQPAVFYSEINLSSEYTQLVVTKSWYYLALIIYFFSLNLILSGFLLKMIGETTRRGLKTGLKVFYAGLSIGGILALVFNLMLMTSNPELTWIGPMGTSISMLSFYYSAVRFKTISLTSRWMKIMSYVVLATTGLMLYVLVFYVVFTVLFRVATPSIPVLILNAIMAAVLLLAMPAINEFTAFMSTLMYTDRINLSYIAKKLEAIDASEQTLDLREVARFLADSMHYNYVAFVIDGKTYASEGARMKTHEIVRTDVLKDAKGQEFGQVVFSGRETRGELPRREVVKHEAVVGMLAAMIEK